MPKATLDLTQESEIRVLGTAQSLSRLTFNNCAVTSRFSTDLYELMCIFKEMEDEYVP